LSEAKHDLLDVIDVPKQVRRYPIGALLVAAVGGLALSGPLRGAIRKHGGALATLALASKTLKGLVTTQLVAKALNHLPFVRGGASMSSRDPLWRFIDSLRI
jgi:hypothetical protein